MAKALNITISNKLYEEIEREREDSNESNRSEFIEELIRIGFTRLQLSKTKKRRSP